MTKILYLLRHAKAEQAPADAPAKDHERPLSPRGRNAAQRMADIFKLHPLALGRVYCSTSRRTRETYTLTKPALGGTPVSFRDSLYLASAEDLLPFVQALPDKLKSALLIGHNPGLHDLALSLVARAAPGQSRALDRMRSKFPTGALCILSFDSNAWSKVDTGTGVMSLFLRPRDLEPPA